MSTIERAIIGDAAEPEKKPATAPAERESAITRALVGDLDSPEEAPAASAAAPAAPSAPAEPVSRPVAQRPVPTAKPSVAPPPPPDLPESKQPDPHLSDEEVDAERFRLASQGFVFPESGPHQLAEEYRHIKRRLLGNTVPGIMKSNRPSNLMMVTSSVPGEGKTFTSVNIALSIAAELDRTVLLVDSDIIKSDLSGAFQMRDKLGLFDYLERPEMGVENVIYRTAVPSLSIIPAGRSARAISEKLASGSMQRLTDELAQRYHDRVIIFDCPPVLATSGATALAPHVSQVVMVVEARDTAHGTVREALKVIGEGKVTGLILNKSKSNRSQSDYYYGYGYRMDDVRY